jgi:hypothetical protein
MLAFRRAQHGLPLLREARAYLARAPRVSAAPHPRAAAARGWACHAPAPPPRRGRPARRVAAPQCRRRRPPPPPACCKCGAPSARMAAGRAASCAHRIQSGGGSGPIGLRGDCAAALQLPRRAAARGCSGASGGGAAAPAAAARHARGAAAAAAAAAWQPASAHMASSRGVRTAGSSGVRDTTPCSAASGSALSRLQTVESRKHSRFRTFLDSPPLRVLSNGRDELHGSCARGTAEWCTSWCT